MFRLQNQKTGYAILFPIVIDMRTWKKYSARFFLVCFMVTAFQKGAVAQWTQTDGPFGGSVSALAVSGDTVIAGTELGGVFISTNDGTGWRETDSGLPSAYVASIAIESPDVLLGTNVGIFRSTNDGGSWTASNLGLIDSSINALTFFNGNLMAGTQSGVYMSMDTGKTWLFVGLNGIDVQSLAASGSNLFAATDDSSVFMTSFTPTAWRPIGLKDIYVYAIATSSSAGVSNLFAGTFGNGIYLSSNNGTKWTPVDAGLADSTVQSVVVSPSPVAGRSTILTGTSNGIFLSTNNGTSWSLSGLSGLSISALAVTPPFAGVGPATILAGTNSGLFMSTNGGGSWVQAGLTPSTVNALATYDSSLYAGTAGNGLSLSTTDGAAWSRVWSTGYTIDAVADSGAEVVAGINDGVFLSTDGGALWTHTGFPSPIGVVPVLAVVVSGTNIFAGSSGKGVYVSTNYGVNWVQSNSGITNTTVRALSLSGGNLFAGTNSGVFLSTDDGTNWTPQGLSGIVINSIAIASIRSVGTDLYAGTNDGVFLSTNNGSIWTQVNGGLTDTLISSIVTYGTNVFAGTDSSGVFLSTSNGASWYSVNSGLTSTDVVCLAIGDTNLYAGTIGGGVWRRPLSQMVTGIEGHSDNVVQTFRLNQNYPNPFNPSTIISYLLAKKSHVTLTIYDVLGRRVATLVNQNENAGSYDVRFDGSALTSGVYFYRLQAAAYSQTRKLLLLK